MSVKAPYKDAKKPHIPVQIIWASPPVNISNHVKKSSGNLPPILAWTFWRMAAKSSGEI